MERQLGLAALIGKPHRHHRLVAALAAFVLQA
jgi:hypothetical protein